MTEKERIEQCIQKAYQDQASGRNFLYSVEEGPNLFRQLEGNFETVKRRKHNETLIHLALIGLAMEKHKEETIPLTLSHRDVKVAIFLAKAFPNVDTIWYLMDVSPENIKDLKQNYLNLILKELGDKKKTTLPLNGKRRLGEETSFSTKKICTTWDDQDFEEWLNGDKEFLDGLDQVSETKLISRGEDVTE